MRILLLPLLSGFCLAQQFTVAPLLPGDDVVAPSAGNQRRPSLAAGPAGQTLLVWEDDRSSLVDTVFGGQSISSAVPGNADIYATFVDGTGQPTGPAPFVVTEATWDQRRPRAAWNGSTWLVVFESTAPTLFYYSRGIYGVRIDANGAVLDPTPIRIDDDDGVDEMFPVVTAVDGDWMVAWADSNGAVATVQAAIVDANGSVAAQKPILVTGSVGQAPTQHELASIGGVALLAWSINNSSGIRARQFAGNGAPIGAVMTLSGSASLRPAVASDPTGFYVAWFGNGQVVGTPVAIAGGPALAAGVVLGAGGANVQLAVASAAGQWLVAIPDTPSVRAVRVDAAGAVVGAPFAVTTSPRSLDDITAAPAGNGVLLAWTDRRTTPNQFGNDQDDVFTAAIGAGGPSPAAAATQSPPAQIADAIAGDAEHGFLCVYRSLVAGVTRFMGQALDGDGAPLGVPFVVHEHDRSLGVPDVAWNGSEFVVVWHQLMSIVANGPPPLVFARRVLLDGTALDPVPLQVMEGASPVVDAVGSEFLIVAAYHHVVLQSNSVVRGRRLDGASGAFVGGPTMVQYGASGPVDVVGLVDRWFVAWGRGTATYVLDTGAVQPSFYAADTGSNGSVTRLASNAARDEAVLVYQYKLSSMPHPDVRMRRFDLAGGSPDPLLGPLVAGQNQGQWRPTVVALDGEYLAAWADHRDSLDYEPGLGDVYAGRMSANGLALDPLGIAVLDTPAPEGAQVAIRSGRGSALLVSSQVVGAGFGAHRLRIHAYANAATTPWSSLGTGIVGVAGVPGLDGYGQLTTGTPFELTVRGAAAGAFGVFVLGLAPVHLPLFGGVLVPAPEVLLPMNTSATGDWLFFAAWPPAAGGTNLYAQAWILDGTGVQGFAATAGLQGTAP